MPIIKKNAGLYEREPDVLDIDISDISSDIAAGDLIMLWEALDNASTTQTITDNLALNYTGELLTSKEITINKV